MTVAPDRSQASQQRRRLRFQRRATLARLGALQAHREGGWDQVSWRRTAGCGKVLTGDHVEIHAKRYPDGSVNAYPVGVSTCGSVWLCDVCKAKIRTRRSGDIETVAPMHVASGGRLVMMTLTVRHGPQHPLALLMDVETDSYRSLQRDARWTSMRRHQLVGQIRSWEITHGLSKPGGSWHPHFHILLFIKPGEFAHIPPVGDKANHAGWVHELGWIEDAWAERIENRLGARPDSHGFHVMELDASAAPYVSKLADETARADLKTGSRSTSHIIDALGDGETWAVRAWNEYATATKGKRAIQWSRGLRAHFGLDVELTDEEIAATDQDGTLIERRDPRWLRRMMHAGYGETPRLVAYLEGIEARFRHHELGVTNQCGRVDDVASPPPAGHESLLANLS